jgi:ABC-2 type transport system permease protein
MSLSRSLAITRNELRLLRRDPSSLILVIVAPVVIVALLRNSVRATLVVTGHTDVSGADFAVPAQAVTFLFFVPVVIGLSFLREHGWSTWDRLRASYASPAEITVGKLLPMLALSAAQMIAIFGAGLLWFGLEIRGSAAGVAGVSGALILAVVALGAAVTAIVKSVQQLNAIGNIGAIGLAALGGALMPLATLPLWVSHVAPVTPQYWAMRGYNALVLDGQGFAAALLPIAMLLLFAAGFTVLAVWRFRFADVKLS